MISGPDDTVDIDDAPVFLVEHVIGIGAGTGCVASHVVHGRGAFTVLPPPVVPRKDSAPQGSLIRMQCREVAFYLGEQGFRGNGLGCKIDTIDIKGEPTAAAL